MDHGSPTELRDLLARLNARLAVQEETNATLSTQFAALQSRQRRRQARRGRSWLAGAVLASFLALVPLGLLAANPFNDLTGGVHDANIDAIYNAGITTGCVPNVAYCPTDFVTREQMASFLARTAGLGSNPPVANALTAQTAVSAQTAQQAQNATSAGNATTMGGYAPNGLVRAARAEGSVVATGDPYVTVLTLTVIAPAPGLVVVSVGAQGIDVDGAGGANSCPCEANLILRHVQSNTEAPHLMAIDITGVGGHEDEDSANVSYAFPVGAGTNTFQLRANKIFGQSFIQVSAQGFAIYVPFGYDGGAAPQP